MCGAFSIILTPSGWKEIFRVESPKGWKSIYNARPTDILPIITSEHPKLVTAAVWNYIPHWLRESKGRGVINARAEGVATKPYFRTSFKTKRCIIPADGFYEWQRKAKISVPYRFIHKDNKPFAFAGLYDELPDASGNIGFAIITTDANELVAQVHDRMPVMFDRTDEELWLDSTTTTDQAQTLLRPYPAEEMTMYPVSRRVNYAKNKDASVIEAVP